MVAGVVCETISVYTPEPEQPIVRNLYSFPDTAAYPEMFQNIYNSIVKIVHW